MAKIVTTSNNIKPLLLGLTALTIPPALIHKNDTTTPVNQDDVLNYLDANPSTLANKSNVNKNYEDMTDEEISECFDDDPYYVPGNYLSKEEIGNLKKELKIKELRQIVNICAKEKYLTKELICLITELNQLYKETTDTRIKQEVINKLRMIIQNIQDPECQFSSLDYPITKKAIAEAINIIDAVNMLDNKYVRYRRIYSMPDKVKLVPTANTVYYKKNKENLQQQLIKYFSEGGTSSIKANDFLKSLRREGFIELLLDENIDSDFLNMVYESHYLKNENVSNEVKNICMKINEKYNVKILLSQDTDYEILSDIEQELNEWVTKGHGEAKLPKVIDLNLADILFDNKTLGYANAYEGFIKLIPEFGFKLNGQTRNILRHELTHLNTKEVIDSVNARDSHEAAYKKLKARDFQPMLKYYESLLKKYELHDQIIKYKVIKDKNGSSIKVLDFENCKYREEFLNAGISPEHVKYAYKNIKEFLAVASEGDMTKYSDEFKEILLKLGMPEFILTLDTLFEKSICSLKVAELKEKNPQAKTYDKLVDVIQQDKKNTDKEWVELMQSIFCSVF